jgi:hypothetical protein
MVCLVNAFDLNSEEYRGQSFRSLEVIFQRIHIDEFPKRIGIEIEIEVLR